MELHKKIKENRIQEICDKYIGKSVKGNKPISEKDVASLSCAELVVLYYNTEWLIERSNGDSVDTGLENQILLMDLIKERVKTSTLYVIHTDATNLPFLTENKSILVYTEKRFADMVACSLTMLRLHRMSLYLYLKVLKMKCGFLFLRDVRLSSQKKTNRRIAVTYHICYRLISLISVCFPVQTEVIRNPPCRARKQSTVLLRI